MRAPDPNLPVPAGRAAIALPSPRDHGGLLLLAVQAFTLVAMTATVATKVWQDHMWFGFLLVGMTAAAWAPELKLRRERTWWFAYIAGIFVYTLLRALADETLIPVRTSYPISFDRALFLGNDPIEFLQHRFFDVRRTRFLEVAAVGMHWSFFLAPHLMAVAVYRWRRMHFRPYVFVIVGTMYLGLLLFFLVPTSPPWMAAQHGHLDSVYRVMDFVGGRVSQDTYDSFYQSLGEPNSVAAMPSIHEGVTFAMYLWARDYAKRLAPWLLLYAVVMGLSLMYLAEHYLLDLLAGVAVATLCWMLAKRFYRLPAIEPAQAAR